MYLTEKMFFKSIIGLGLGVGVMSWAIALIFGLEGFINFGTFSFMVGLVFALLWFAQACSDSMDDYGLREGTEALYGEEASDIMRGVSKKEMEAAIAEKKRQQSCVGNRPINMDEDLNDH